MPELPEIECLSTAVRSHVLGWKLSDALFFRDNLRELIPKKILSKEFVGQNILSVTRRSKYMLLETKNGYGVFHLGMSGKMFFYDDDKPKLPHTHAVFEFSKGEKRQFLHYIDPRRFGLIDFCATGQLNNHRYFKNLGPEPLETDRLGNHFFKLSRDKSRCVKSFIMDAHIVVGVGNIYANESLFHAGIHPERAVKTISKESWNTLAKQIRKTLRLAIKAGGSTIKDFQNPEGNPGYFSHSHQVYSKAQKPCNHCQTPIEATRTQNRATYFCPSCQS